MSGGPDPLYIRARTALLDAALAEQLNALVLVGAQAIYLQTGHAEFAAAEYTTDADFCVSPAVLTDAPLLPGLLKARGFSPGEHPGAWSSPDGIPVDLMVPETLAGSGSRGARLGPHGKRAARRAKGLEGALVDRCPITIPSLHPEVERSVVMRVAGPAALLVAKIHKIAERVGAANRASDKDALDVLRLLQATETATLAAGLARLAEVELSTAVTEEAVSQLAPLFGNPQAPGIRMAVRAGRLNAEAHVISASFTALVSDLLTVAKRTRLANQPPLAGSANSPRPLGGTTDMLSRGSEWNRWDPHIHSPGTVLNDQFRGADPWSGYLETLEAETPAIRAIGVADYYLTDNYERVLTFKEAGRLPDVQLIFPNVEMRLDAAAKTGFVNIHLLVSPEDPNHLHELRRILSRLTFSAFADSFTCTREDLVRLGKRAKPDIKNERAALREGATQFKVSFSELRELFGQNAWAKQNILIAVAGGSGDGTSGLRKGADVTLRQEIETFAHIIFSSNQAQREFWLGQRSATEEQLRERYGGLKPCLHGSDAHSESEVGDPEEDRFSWVKGGVEFDSLRQACIGPVGRVCVGPNPPATAMLSQVISSLTVESADWFGTDEIPLNPGLVTVIGARGSGKTALAEMIATGCDGVPQTVWDSDAPQNSSFLTRARDYLDEGRVCLVWGGGEEVSRYLDGRNAGGPASFTRLRYLSQQFVEDLCSARGPTDGLIAELERVVFEAHPHESRDGALDFAELRERRTQRFRQARSREASAILQVSQRIGEEMEKERLAAPLARQVEQKKKQVDGYRADLGKLVIKGSDAYLKRHQELQAAAQVLRKQIEGYKEQRRAFEGLLDEVTSMRATIAPEMLRQSQARHPGSRMTAEQWNEFLLDYRGRVDESLGGYVKWVDGKLGELMGTAPQRPTEESPYVAEDEDLKEVKLSVLEAEIARLEGLLNADKLVRKQYAALSRRIGRETAALQTLEGRLGDANGAGERRRKLQRERNEAYERVFDAILSEEQALADLYAPIRGRLKEAGGTLSRLGFSISRSANAEKWADYAEENLLDRRLEGPFRGRGALVKRAESELKPRWETGSASEVTKAMSDFITTYQKDFLVHAPVPREEHEAFRTWLGRFAEWLFNTDHIIVRYGVAYDGVDIEKLSPGTRGIVLLLLYLALDDDDDRPLVIDQPEENLDPQSVFDELVPIFAAAKARRQVVMVTHNPNLVINTDADQVIIADARPQAHGGLPRLTYRAGGLDNAGIRKAVCDILEGGELAFQERARRLRVQLER